MTRHLLAISFLLVPLSLPAAELAFRVQELATRLTVGYATRVVDMNADGKLDIAIVDSDRILWLENPTWKEHVVLQGQTKRDNVCFAPADIDGDGRLDLAIGADWRPFDTKTGGTIQWIRHAEKPDTGWTLLPIGEEPVVHRMNFADLDGDKKQELIVVPLMGRGTTKPNFAESGTRILSYKIPANPLTDRWLPEVINEDLHVTHNFQVTDVNADGKPDILVVSFEGVHLLERDSTGKWKKTHIGAGNQATSPNKGASEIKLGQFAKDAPYIATIEPWHGSQVVVYTPPKGKDIADPLRAMWDRHVVDEDLLWGHAVATANLDGDSHEELIIGIRDKKNADHDCGLRIYDPQDASGAKWKVHRIDPGGVAIEDLATGDFDGDGKTDIVAVGRATHNVRVYWNITK